MFLLIVVGWYLRG